MNKALITITLLLHVLITFPQTNSHGNPVFNSITLWQEPIENYELSLNYYTLSNNINNKTSSVYISDNPSLNETEEAAINLPSDFFILTKDQVIVCLIMIRNTPSRTYFVVNPSTGEKKEYTCKIKGDISENRANEIIKEGFDPTATINNGKLFFNNKNLSIATNEKIKEDVLRLIKKEKLNSGEPSGKKLLSKEDLRKIVITESKEGGKLDFFTPIKGNEYDGVQIKPGVFTTNLGVALYAWGRANYELGVNNINDVIEFWEEFKGRKLNEREKVYITRGFNKDFEK